VNQVGFSLHDLRTLMAKSRYKLRDTSGFLIIGISSCRIV